MVERKGSDPLIPGPKDTRKSTDGEMASGGAATLAHLADMDAYDMDLSTPGLSNSIATPDQISEILRDIMDIEVKGKKVFVDSATAARLLV